MKRLILAGLALATLAGQAAIPNWPQFRGANCSGVAENDRPPIQFGPETNRLWKTAVPGGASSPCVWGDHVFLTGRDGDKLITLAISRGDGRELWRQAAPAERIEQTHKRGSPASATPATDGERVYVYFSSFGLLAYDYRGREQWRVPVPVGTVRNGSGTSPVLMNGRLVLNCDQEEGKSFLLALDPGTGKTLWKTPRPEFASGYTTPVSWRHGEAEDIVVVGSLRVVGYAWRDGKERWSAGGLEAISVCPTPVVGDSRLIVMSRSMSGAKIPGFAQVSPQLDKDGDGRLSKTEVPASLHEQGFFPTMDRDTDGQISGKEWDEAIAFLAKGDYGIFSLREPGPEDRADLTGSHVIWKHRKGTPSVSSPLFYKQRIYVVQDGGRATCYDAREGTKLYEQERLGAEGEYYASPVAANNHIYYSSIRGVITVAEAGDALQVRERNNLGEALLATPAIADDKLYVRTAEHLWAFGR